MSMGSVGEMKVEVEGGMMYHQGGHQVTKSTIAAKRVDRSKHPSRFGGGGGLLD